MRYLDLLKMPGKKEKRIFSQMAVKNGDESHGIESVKNYPTKQIQGYVVANYPEKSLCCILDISTLWPFCVH